MLNGASSTLRPLRDAIAKAKPIDHRMVAIDGAILGKLVELIDQDRLMVKRPPGHRKNKSPELFARDLVGALRFEKHPHKESRSAAVFKEIASELDMPESALRDAVTWLRKARTEWRAPKNELTP